jgi:hypothetical protein
MRKYGEVALKATELVTTGACSSVVDAWHLAAAETFDKQSLRDKQCPKNTYLGLCQEGYVVGIRAPLPGMRYTTAPLNSKYAFVAVRLLSEDPTLAALSADELWRRVMNEAEITIADPESRSKRHNSQMDVVLALWSHGLIEVNRSVLPPRDVPDSSSGAAPKSKTPAASSSRLTRDGESEPQPPKPEPVDRTGRLQKIKLLVEIAGGVVATIGAIIALVWRTK